MSTKYVYAVLQGIYLGLIAGCTGKSDSVSGGETTIEPGEVVWEDLSPEGTTATFTGIHLNQGNVWLSATGGSVRLLNGDFWTVYDADADIALNVEGLDLHDIWGLDNTIVAVGDNGKVATFTGTWAVQDLGTANFDSVDGNGVGNLMVAGWGGIYANGGGTWGKPYNITGNPLINHIWYDGSTGLAVGKDGARAEFGGVNWVVDPDAETRTLYGVHAISNNDGWAVGERGVAFHFDGTEWVFSDTGTNASLWSVWMAGPDSVYAVGSSGVALWYNGEEWIELETGTSSTLYSITGSSDTDVWAAGASGTLLHFTGISSGG